MQHQKGPFFGRGLSAFNADQLDDPDLSVASWRWGELQAGSPREDGTTASAHAGVFSARHPDLLSDKGGGSPGGGSMPESSAYVLGGLPLRRLAGALGARYAEWIESPGP